MLQFCKLISFSSMPHLQDELITIIARMMHMLLYKNKTLQQRHGGSIKVIKVERILNSPCDGFVIHNLDTKPLPTTEV